MIVTITNFRCCRALTQPRPLFANSMSIYCRTYQFRSTFIHTRTTKTWWSSLHHKSHRTTSPQKSPYNVFFNTGNRHVLYYYNPAGGTPSMLSLICCSCVFSVGLAGALKDGGGSTRSGVSTRPNLRGWPLECPTGEPSSASISSFWIPLPSSPWWSLSSPISISLKAIGSGSTPTVAKGYHTHVVL